MPGVPPPQTGPLSAPTFINELASKTGLDPRVIEAWVKVEGAYAKGGTGGNNFLNIRERVSKSGVPIVGYSKAGFAHFATASDAASEAAAWINEMPNYLGVRRAAKLGPRSQLAAIAASPWDAGHYNGGRTLYAAYDSIRSGGGSVLSGLKSVGKGIVSAGSGDPLGALGDIPGVGSIPGVGGVTSVLTAPATIAEDAAKVLGFIFNPQDWLRIGYILGGGIMVIGGLFILARSVGVPSVVQSAVAASPEGQAYKQGHAQGRQAAARREGRKAGASSIASRESLAPRAVYSDNSKSGDIPF